MNNEEQVDFILNQHLNECDGERCRGTKSYVLEQFEMARLFNEFDYFVAKVQSPRQSIAILSAYHSNTN